MGRMTLDKTERRLMALLKAALNEIAVETDLFEQMTAQEWTDCYRMALDQGVMAMAWDGVQTLPKEMMPQMELKVNWALNVEEQEKWYERYCMTAQNLAEFYKKHGIDMMVMKGVGFSSYYPIPAHRQGGDIDIFTWSADKEKMSDMEANELADKLMEEQGIDVDCRFYKHSEFEYLGIPIENHKDFLEVRSMPMARPLEDLLQAHRTPKAIDLLEGKYSVKIPMEVFNTVFISFHALQHIGTGICLHHVVDWACLLKKYGLNMPEGVEDRNYLEFVYALTEVCNRWLGTEVAVKASERKMEVLMEHVLHPKFKPCWNSDSRNPFKILAFKWRLFYYVYVYCRALQGRSCIKPFFESMIRHACYPKGLFKTA